MRLLCGCTSVSEMDLYGVVGVSIVTSPTEDLLVMRLLIAPCVLKKCNLDLGIWLMYHLYCGEGQVPGCWPGRSCYSVICGLPGG